MNQLLREYEPKVDLMVDGCFNSRSTFAASCGNIHLTER